jgi:hypothetical protein
MDYDIIIIYEHPEWHQPLFETLERRGVSFGKIDLKRAAYHEFEEPAARIYYNLVSPSAYKRKNQKAIPYAFALCRHLEMRGAKVLNGSRSMMMEMSKSAQTALLASLNIPHPETLVFNDLEALSTRKDEIPFPAILKPEQGGSGARMYLVHNWSELEEVMKTDEAIWFPDNLLLIQEQVQYDADFGIIRLEFLGGKFLYAMRVVTHNVFNLCPSLMCNPEEGDGVCDVPQVKQPEFYPYEDVDNKMIADGLRILKEAGHDSGSIEFCIDKNGKGVVYDINANSNLRPPVAAHFGIDAFEKVVDFLIHELNKTTISS